MIKINGKQLGIKDVTAVARDRIEVELTNEARKKVDRAREMVDKLVQDNKVVYGITTGFGSFSDTKISPEEVLTLQENLIKSHAAGTGEPLAEEVVRAMILLRINALAKGHSGIRYSTLKLLIDFLNKEIHPIVPSQGSVGASGDLVPLAHISLALLGKGEVLYRGKKMKASEALDKAGLKPVKLASKEGLALINGTQMMGALGVLAVNDAVRLCKIADIALGLTMEGLKGILAPYDDLIHQVRPHPGQRIVAENIRNFVKKSSLVLSEREDRVQDAYTIRCAPQVHGASRDSIKHVQEILAREINSATDNPLLFPEENKVISGGNFHGQPLALGLDYLSLAVSELANISERRVARLVDGNLNYGLPMFLTEHGGLNSGYMIAQYTAASLVSENKVLSSPASIDSITTSANQEDHVSMGSISARKVRKVIENLTAVLAIELAVAVQAIEFRTSNINDLGEGSKIVFSYIRDMLPSLEKDRILAHDIETMIDIVKGADLLKLLEDKKIVIK
ncbi:MAG: histidine ammonia-lyase [Bacillota bacterium]